MPISRRGQIFNNITVKERLNLYQRLHGSDDSIIVIETLSGYNSDPVLFPNGLSAVDLQGSFGASAEGTTAAYPTTTTLLATTQFVHGVVNFHIDGLSGNWQNTYTHISNNSGDWQKTKETVRANSGTWGAGGSSDLSELAAISADWSSTHTDVYGNSALWEQNRLDLSEIATTSADWNSTHTDVYGSSALWEQNRLDLSEVALASAIWDSTNTDVYANSAQWEDVFSTVNSNSAMWEENRLDLAEVATTSGLWDSHRLEAIAAISNIATTSANWDSVYTTTNTYSGQWDAAGDLSEVTAASSNWENTYSTVFSNSGTGTTNTIAKWTTDVKLGDSIIIDDGSLVTVGGNVSAKQLSAFGLSLSGVNTRSVIGSHESILVDLGTDGDFIVSANNVSHDNVPVLYFDNQGVLSVGKQGDYIRPQSLSLQYALAVGGHTSASGNFFTSAGELITGITVQEADSSPSVTGVTKLVVSNGSLTDNGSGQVTITTGAGDTGDLSELAASSADWNSTHTDVYGNSAQWDDVVSTVKNLSSQWEENRLDLSVVALASGEWDANTADISEVATTSADWNNTETTLRANSAMWEVNRLDLSEVATNSGSWNAGNLSTSEIAVASSDWDNAKSTLYANSAMWEENRLDLSEVATNSANWDSINTDLFANSANWTNTYTTVSSNSARWKATSMSWDDSSGIITQTFGDASTITVDIDGRYPTGQGTANYIPMWVTASNLGDSIAYYTGSDGKLRIGGPLSASEGLQGSSVLLHSGSGSDQWGSVFSTVFVNSGSWNTTGSTGDLSEVAASSADWNSTHTDVYANSANWLNTYSHVYSQSGAWGTAAAGGWTDDGSVVRLSTSTDKVGIGTTSPNVELSVHGSISADGKIYSYTSNSDQWEGAWSTLNSNSALWEENRLDLSEVATTSAIWNSTNTDVYANSARWEDVFSTVNAESADWNNTQTTVNSFSSQWEENRLDIAQIVSLTADWSSTHTDVHATSSVWDSTHTDVYANSAFWDSSWTVVNANSSLWEENRLDISEVATTSAGWDNAETTLRSNSAIWLRNQDHFTTVNVTSGKWNNAHAHVFELSGTWRNTYANVFSNSAAWGTGGSAQTTVNSYSGLWLNPLSAYSVGETRTATTTLSAYRAVYIAADGTYQLACANTTLSADVAGIVTKGAAVNGQTFDIVRNGITDSNIAHGFTVGQAIFLGSDPTNPGVLTETEPTAVGDINKPVGVAATSDQLLVQVLRGIKITGSTNLSAAAGWTNDDTVVKLTTSTDKVGIGTDDPNKELTVAGSISAQDSIEVTNLTVNGSLTAQGPTYVVGVKNWGHENSHGGTIAPLSFADSNTHTAVTTGSNISITSTAGRQIGSTLTLRISGINTASLSFNSDWVFLGSKPATLPADKVGILALQSFGTAESDIIAAFALQA